MKRFLSILFIAVLAGCGSTQISYDVDKNVDFTKFKTFAFTPETYKLGVQELNRNRIIDATTKQMEARGYTKTEATPDVLVDILVSAAQKQEAVTTGTGGYGYGYRWGGAGMTTTTINNYVEGSLFVNVIANNNLVWQGRATRTLDENASPQQRETNINNAIADMFKKYPVQPPKK